MADQMKQDAEMGYEQTEDDAMTEQQAVDMQQQNPENGQGQEQECTMDEVEVDDDTEDDRKLFVGGVSWEATNKDLKEYFEKFGKVLNCTLKTDHETQKSRGFGFVCFASTDSVDKVLNATEPHKMHGRVIDPKKAAPRPKKIFVGKLDPETSQDEVKAHFAKYGEIEKLEMPYDNTKQKRRAFCFVEFKKMSSFKKCLEEGCHKINTQEVDVKKATIQQGSGMRGGGRGRGGFGPGSRGGRGGGFQGQYGGGYGANSAYYGGGAYYDPSGYYDQQGYYNDQYYGNNYYGGGWNGAGYNQGYNNYNNYGYDDWGYGHGGGNQSNYGKTQKRGGGQGYHPYNR